MAGIWAHGDEALSRRGHQEAKIAIAFLTLSWFFVLLRIWTRTYVISNFGWDDGTMILATMIFTVFCTTMLFLQANGGGTHVSAIGQLQFLIRWTIVSEATYVMAVMVLKISVGIFFLRIVAKQWMLWTIYFTVAATVISCTASLFYVIFRCGANIDNYVPRQLSDKCTPLAVDHFFGYQQASFTTLTDTILVILPIFILWNASMDTRTKISVGLILSLAALGVICSAIRFRFVNGLTHFDDFYWNATNISIWSTIEPGTGIIAGCLATLRPFLKTCIGKAWTIRDLASNSAKQYSHSFRSNTNSSRQRPPLRSNGSNSNVTKVCPGTEPTGSIQRTQEFELKSDIGKKNENTSFILTGPEELEYPWLRRPTHTLTSEDEARGQIPANV